MSAPIAIDLFTGLHGWAEGLVAEGYRVRGYDIEDMCAKFGVPRPEAVELFVQDVLTLHGSQFADAALIVASPPCQFFSYTAMPWQRAKNLAKEVRADPERLAKELALFNACFRIQAEASLAAGRHIPMVVENVRGAQPWVGRARWNFGSFFLWGNVPALMPITVGREIMKAGVTHRSDGTTNFHGHDGVKAPGMNWSDPTKRGQDFTRLAGKHSRLIEDGYKGSGPTVPEDTRSNRVGLGQWRDGHKVPGFRFDGSGRSFQTASVHKTEGHPNKRDGHPHTRHLTNPGEYGVDPETGTKIGGDWFSDPQSTCRRHGSKSKGRKMASAMIAKIPLTLSRHIAAAYRD